jgi:orotidine-5'-phosphate decarboxylase
MITALDIPIILDVKRGDIGSTAEHYALAAYEVLGADAVTLSPYMGWDSIKPFVSGKYRTKGAFLLCKTSNSSSGVSVIDVHSAWGADHDVPRISKTIS